MIAYCADYIFTGESILPHHAIVADNHVIVDIIAQVSLDNSIQRIQYGKHMLVPAFIDAQIYGSGNLLFSEYQNISSLSQLQQDCKKSGVAYFLPTVATNTNEVIFACIDAIKDYWHQDKKGCLGLHVEGPWISVEKRGVHEASCIYSPTIEQVKQVIEYGKGVIKMITLAPEVCGNDIIEYICSQDIIVAAGH
ncbi:MAG: N-acetylglucosamine-6-phosphate deacetylase, partial [Chitinophagaceae bacterium]